ncbi:MAG: hypothetical protein JSR45_16255 [Proteobacteria bacterium]|nr:hypothetical protein [Pseudomonadota bacterium]
MSLQQTPPPASPSPNEGKIEALAVYALYLVSWPTVGTLGLAGLIIAYLARGRAAPWVRTHLDKEIRLFWLTLAWVIGGVVLLAVVGTILLPILGLGLLFWLGIGVYLTVVGIWFHVSGVIGLLRLLDNRAADESLPASGKSA